MSELQISEEIMSAMEAHAKRDYPHECCGILIGDFESREVKEALEAENLRKDREDRFEISGDELIRGEKRAQELNLDVLGYYHSHPDHPNEPSEYDRVRAFAGLSYIIISVLNGQKTKSRSWVLSDDTKQFSEERIKVRQDIGN